MQNLLDTPSSQVIQDRVTLGKIASLNAHGRAKKVRVVLRGLARIEPTPFEPECDWTQLWPWPTTLRGSEL